jgi:MFS transporter, OCT family, solute carrier family 22 (organic cation transporter), member 4/5
MNYDDVLVHLGKFGSYQKRTYILLCLPVILCAFHKLSGVFLLAVPNHRCQLPGEPSNNTYELPIDVLNTSFPFDGEKRTFSQCDYFTNNYYNDNNTTKAVSQCSDYVWDTSKYESSAVKSFLLVCDKGKLKPTSDALLMVGVFMGSFLFGQLSDKFGRKKVFVISLASQLVFGLLIAISPEFITYTISRMVSSCFN